MYDQSRFLESTMDEPRILIQPISRAELRLIAERRYGDLVKCVVDVERRKIALGGEMHSDEEQVLIDDGSRQEHLWGINLYPDGDGDAWIEFDSVINLRPRQGNRSRGVDSEPVRASIRAIVAEWIR